MRRRRFSSVNLAAMGVIPITDADILAWQTAVGAGNTSSAELAILQTMVVGIKTDLSISLLSEKFDRLWVPGFCASATAAVVDLAARATFTLTNAPTFTTQKGYSGNGTTQSIDLGFAPNALTRYTQNSASWMVYIQTMETRTAAVYVQMGGGGTAHTNSLIYKNTGTTQMVWAVNDTNNTATTSTLAQSAGRWCGERNASGATQLYFNGSSVANGVTTSGALDSQSVKALADNNAGATSFQTQSTLAVIYWGASLGATAVGQVDTRIHTAGTSTNATNFP